MPRENRQWILRRRPTGPLTEDIFELKTSEAPAPGEGEALVRTLCLSLDPANRVWIVGPSYRPAVELGAVMDGFAVGQVVESNDPTLSPGELVSGDLGWQDYAVRPAATLRKLPSQLDVPISWFLGVLGITGLTAYFGLLDIGRPKPGETVLVSGAAGATGSVVAQIAKMSDCKVVGIAGGPEKCAFLRDELGLDGAIDYRAGNVSEGLKEHCREGVDVYFDNVGGEILGAALLAMRLNGRIVCCGSISSYDTGKIPPSPLGIPSLLIGKRLEMKGFIVLDYAPRFGEAIEAIAGFIQKGKLKVREDRVDGLENAPRGLMGLLAGENIGKRYVQIAAPE